MRVVFLGSPEFALPTLRGLIESPHEVVAVVTQPDRPSGRGHTFTPPPAKAFAALHGAPVVQPERVSAPDVVEALRALEPDVLVVAAYGQILRQAVLDLPKRGSLNVHASLLPRHRGASPIAAAILAGDEVTGVTVMEVVRALDAGPMVAKVQVPVLPTDTTGTLELRLADAGAKLLLEVLEPWAKGDLVATPQDDSLATYAPMLKREDALLDWSLPAIDLWRRVRAFNPWPVAYTTWQGEQVRILEALPLAGDTTEQPGTVLPMRLHNAQLREMGYLPRPASQNVYPEPMFAVQTGSGRLQIITAQRPGKRAMNGLDLLRGQPDLLAQRLGV